MDIKNNFPELQLEIEAEYITEILGYYKMYDCGKIKYHKYYKE